MDSINKFVKYTEIPEEILSNTARILLLNNTYISIENHNGIYEYSSDKVCLKLNKCIFEILGTNLCIKYINDEVVMINGCISDVKFRFLE